MIKELEKYILDRTTPIPLYHQLKEFLIEFIALQPPYTPLPSEPELSLHFAISRPTVRQAIAMLASEGYIYKIQGKGTFVAKRKLVRNFSDWQGSLNEEIRHLGLTPTTTVIGLKAVISDKSIKDTFDIPINTPLIELKRVRAVDGVPILVVHSYIPPLLVPGLFDKQLTNQSLHELLQREYHLTIKKTRRVIEAVSADKDLSLLLKVPIGKALQYFKNTVILDTNEVVEYSLGWYRGDAVSFTFEYEKRTHHAEILEK